MDSLSLGLPEEPKCDNFGDLGLWVSRRCAGTQPWRSGARPQDSFCVHEVVELAVSWPEDP